eukprot:4012356-Lingulodinium_polyedra.AAC.1
MPLKLARVVTPDEMDSSGATLVAGSSPEATIPPPSPVETSVPGGGEEMSPLEGSGAPRA